MLSIHPGEIQAWQWDLNAAGTFAVDRQVSDASPDDYDALLLPGGTMNPDQLRMNREAVGFVKAFVASGKPTPSAGRSWSSSPGPNTACPGDPAAYASVGQRVITSRQLRK